MNFQRMLSWILGGQTISKLGWDAQGDLEDPLEEALEEEVGSLEGDFNSDFVHDLKVGKIEDILSYWPLSFLFCC